jgi:4a-hydroxytetrahydrobiopterin dehydratase
LPNPRRSFTLDPLDTRLETIVALLDDKQIQDGLPTLDGWAHEGRTIARSLTFASFAEAIAFVNRVADLAEEADHHPDIDVRYRDVRLVLSTHSAGGLTGKDFALARKIDRTV